MKKASIEAVSPLYYWCIKNRGKICLQYTELFKRFLDRIALHKTTPPNSYREMYKTNGLFAFSINTPSLMFESYTKENGLIYVVRIWVILQILLLISPARSIYFRVSNDYFQESYLPLNRMLIIGAILHELIDIFKKLNAEILKIEKQEQERYERNQKKPTPWSYQIPEKYQKKIQEIQASTKAKEEYIPAEEEIPQQEKAKPISPIDEIISKNKEIKSIIVDAVPGQKIKKDNYPIFKRGSKNKIKLTQNGTPKLPKKSDQ